MKKYNFFILSFENNWEIEDKQTMINDLSQINKMVMAFSIVIWKTSI